MWTHVGPYVVVTSTGTATIQLRRKSAELHATATIENVYTSKAQNRLPDADVLFCFNKQSYGFPIRSLFVSFLVVTEEL